MSALTKEKPFDVNVQLFSSVVHSFYETILIEKYFWRKQEKTNLHFIMHFFLPFSDAGLEICPRGPTCCTRDMEVKLGHWSSRQYKEAVTNKTNQIANPFNSKANKIQGKVTAQPRPIFTTLWGARKKKLAWEEAFSVITTPEETAKVGFSHFGTFMSSEANNLLSNFFATPCGLGDKTNFYNRETLLKMPSYPFSTEIQCLEISKNVSFWILALK